MARRKQNTSQNSTRTYPNIGGWLKETAGNIVRQYDRSKKDVTMKIAFSVKTMLHCKTYCELS